MIVYKYPLTTRNGTAVLSMPAGAEILSVALQGSVLCLWAQVDAAKVCTSRKIEVVGTGIDMPEIGGERKFIGTVFEDWFVWHVFERLPPC